MNHLFSLSLLILTSILLNSNASWNGITLYPISRKCITTYGNDFNSYLASISGGCTPGIAANFIDDSHYTRLEFTCYQNRVVINGTWGFQDSHGGLSSVDCWTLCDDSTGIKQNCWQDWGTLMPTISSAIMPAAWNCSDKIYGSKTQYMKLNDWSNVSYQYSLSNLNILDMAFSYSTRDIFHNDNIVNCTISLSSSVSV